MRNYARKDRNHGELLEELKKLDWYVTDVSSLPKVCDLRVDGCWHGKPISIVVEIKDGEKYLSKRKLTSCEKDYLDSHPGHLAIVESFSDCLAITALAIKFCCGEESDIIRFKIDDVMARGVTK